MTIGDLGTAAPPRRLEGAENEEFVSIGVKRIPPDPAVMRAIGLNHAFESAVADLVDNSIDAGADHVLIRFVVKDGQVRRILVADDGRGMDEETIDAAMQLGRTRPGVATRLGHFGVGLKSASFSQATSLTVLSRSHGSPPQGRRMSREARSSGFECDVLAEEAVAAALDHPLPGLADGASTIIRWDGLRHVPASRDPQVTASFVEAKQAELRHHLGLVFHRLLAADRIEISIDVLDADQSESGFVFKVTPIDPFAYGRSGLAGYPKTFVARVGPESLPIECHIWPGGSDSQFFKLIGRSAERLQGLYLYRNDRLLLSGGWGGIAQETKRRQLARVRIDIEQHLHLFDMSAEKSGVTLAPDLVRAIEAAQSADGECFADYLQRAEEVFRESNRRKRERPPVVPPGPGLHPKVKKAIGREFRFLEAEPPIAIRWKRLPSDQFARVDRSNQTLWLNQRYRGGLTGGKGSLNDAPLLKALLFLLYEDIFRGVAMGPRDKDNLQIWNSILTAAAAAEEQA